MMIAVVSGILAAIVLAGAVGGVLLHRRNMHLWLFSYVRQSKKRRPIRAGQRVHVLLCMADHFEPAFGNAPAERAEARVQSWVEKYPQLFGQFRDSDGRPPRYTFFYPLEKYDPRHLDALAGLCRLGFGEVEVHHHHDNDTADALRHRLLTFKHRLARDHGLLAKDHHTGEIKYGFVHGDWALDNSRPDKTCCGVDNELAVLRETGCYADFTFPSVPDATQTRKINSIYYATGVPGRCKSHDWGVDAGTAAIPPQALMLIQGPLVLNWRRRKWGLLPRIENGYLQASQPPAIERLDRWLQAHVQMPSRPDWFFVKLHAHGAPEWHQRAVLAEPMVRFQRDLARRARQQSGFEYHYVTAREMYNLARAAEQGWSGSVDDARDFELLWNGGTTRHERPSVLAGSPSIASA